MAEAYGRGHREVETWGNHSDRFKAWWDRQFGGGNDRWEDDESSYRYAWERSNEDRYHGRGWNEVEPEIRQDWQSRHADRPWDRSGPKVRHAWENWSREHQHGEECPPGFGEGRKVELREEELRTRKESVEAGEVRLRKEVTTEERSMDVPVSRDEVYVERHAVDRRPSDRPIGEGETIDVPVYREEVSVEKRPVVREEVSLGKRTVQDTERVSDTVRREEAHIEAEGNVTGREVDTHDAR